MLSPDQIKFNQENLQKRFEEEDVEKPRRSQYGHMQSTRNASSRNDYNPHMTNDSDVPRDFTYDMPITSATGDLSGIGMLSQSLMQVNEDQYLSNSSVAKTAAAKRRNISVGLGVNQMPDRGGLDTA